MRITLKFLVSGMSLLLSIGRCGCYLARGLARPLSVLRPITSSQSTNSFTTLSSLSSDTIFALSSGPITKTGVAVIRLSGPQSAETLIRLTKKPLPEPRRASLRKLYCPFSGDTLDSALILYMPGPKSFTGEDVVELHVHGSRAVIVGLFDVFDNLSKNSDAIALRPAERGEFTRRAFDHGRMDLTEVEGLADLLAAETSLQRSQALRQMDGKHKQKYEEWRSILIKSLAYMEAVIDFGDDDREDDVDDTVLVPLIPSILALKATIDRHLMDGHKGELVREGIKIALVGPPNAGKSSLINALAKRPAAIVSPIAGTTRDIVQVTLDLGGVPCLVSDTAGLRVSSDVIENEGIVRARAAYDEAQIRIFVTDASVGDSAILEAESMLTTSGVDKDRQRDAKVLRIRNKADLLPSLSAKTPVDGSTPTFSVSCLTGAGISELEISLESMVTSLVQSDDGQHDGNSAGARDGVLITRQRHRHHLEVCSAHLGRFLGTDGDLLMDTAAEELRLAAMAIGRITGRVDVEELLDVIFRDFCIGK